MRRADCRRDERRPVRPNVARNGPTRREFDPNLVRSWPIRVQHAIGGRPWGGTMINRSHLLTEVAESRSECIWGSDMGALSDMFFSICVCHPCAAVMLIVSESCQVYRMVAIVHFWN